MKEEEGRKRWGKMTEGGESPIDRQLYAACEKHTVGANIPGKKARLKDGGILRVAGGSCPMRGYHPLAPQRAGQRTVVPA